MGFHSAEGFLDFEDEMKELIKKVEKKDEVLEFGAQKFVKDLKKLPSPRSEFNGRHTHLIDTFAYKQSKYNKENFVVGWGKYYGRMVEQGHKKRNGRGRVKAQPHLIPLWERNKQSYYKQMVEKLGL